MLDYALIRRRWSDFVSIATPGVGPWVVQHDRTLGWCVKRPRVTGTRPIQVQSRSEAVAVSAALNAVAGHGAS